MTQKAKNAYEKAVESGKAVYDWGKSKLRESFNVAKNWTESLDKTMNKFCTTTSKWKNQAVELAKSDLGKVAVGVGAAFLVTGVVVLTGGTAAPILIGAAISAGSGAIFNGGLTYFNGGSTKAILSSAADGFMWGAIAGSIGGAVSSLVTKGTQAGSSLLSNLGIQKGLDIATDTVVDLMQSTFQGDLSLIGFGTSLAMNFAFAGNANGQSRAIKDSIDDSVQREVKETIEAKTQHEIRESLDAITDGTHYSGQNLKPNLKYATGEHNYVYTTNEKGLIKNVEVEDLKYKTYDKRLRHNPNSYGKLEGDHAGHLIADRFGGSPELDNIVSQSKNVNCFLV